MTSRGDGRAAKTSMAYLCTVEGAPSNATGIHSKVRGGVVEHEREVQKDPGV